MTKDLSVKTEICSQIETNEPALRVVLLGASTLSLMFPTIVETTRALFAQPLEMFVAKGFGRSYGQQSKFFGKIFSGILQSGLWEAMDRARPLPTVAIMADVGNDLAYEAPLDTIVEWIETALERLTARGAHVVLNNIPLTSLRRVGRARYHFFRELFFPSCRLSRADMLRRAERLSEALDEVAAVRQIPVFSGEIQWYGLDPIHPRRRASGEIWRRMLAELSRAESLPALARPPRRMAAHLHSLRPESWVQFGVARRAAQPNARLSDGTTISLY
jgi:hypothetical protein